MAYISNKDIVVGQSSCGRNIIVNKITITGSDSNNAPSVYMQASMHASELQGNTVIYNLYKYFKNNQPLGDIVLVPMCNPIGQDNFVGAGHHSRFDPVTGDNWNRFYHTANVDYVKFVNDHINSRTEIYKKSFEKLLKTDLHKSFEDNKWEKTRAQRLNMVLQCESQKSDIVLDLHTDSEAITSGRLHEIKRPI